MSVALDAPDVVYLHCRGGIGRTGTVAGCLLVDNGWTAEDALALIDRKWRVMARASPALRSPENAAQREMIERWSGRANSR
jgi:protein-tyrosine phosphatase